MLRNDLRRAILGKGFLLAVMLLFTMLYFGEYERVQNGRDGSIITHLELALGIGPMSWAFPAAGALCYANGYLADSNTGNLNYQLSRTGIVRYVFPKVVACFISACLATMLGIALYMAFVSGKIGILMDERAIAQYKDSANSFDRLLYEGRYYCYMLVHMLCEGLCAGMWSVFGLALTGIWHSSYAACIAPAIVLYVKDYVYAWLKIPFMTTLRAYQLGYIANIPGILLPLAITAGAFIGIAMLLGACLAIILRRQKYA